MTLEDREKQAFEILGLKPESIGKTQARQNFLPLVDGLNQSASAVEITDHEKPVAMLISYNHWLTLMSKLTMLSKKDQLAQPLELIGSIKIVGDLDVASKNAADSLTQSIKETVEKL